MHRTINRPAMAAGMALIAVGALTACAPAPEDGRSVENDAAAARFVACLDEAGQTAKLLDGGQVGLLLPDEPGDEGSLATTQVGGDGPVSSVAVFMDEEGAWMAGSSADAYPEAGGLRDAWLGCETEVPEFEQPKPDMSGVALQPASRADMIESSLAFAECARGEGYADFPDPDADAMLDFPPGFTEDGFRELLDACMAEDGMGFLPISPESAESFDFDWMSIMAEAGGGTMGIAVPAGPIQ
ncbi:MAG: hypothetical protein J7480_04490 [Microbacteriaceae bacterium]|nr:hypothetical protein [Microbacteriaceae bacterium]